MQNELTTLYDEILTRLDQKEEDYQHATDSKDLLAIVDSRCITDSVLMRFYDLIKATGGTHTKSLLTIYYALSSKHNKLIAKAEADLSVKMMEELRAE